LPAKREKNVHLSTFNLQSQTFSAFATNASSAVKNNDILFVSLPLNATNLQPRDLYRKYTAKAMKAKSWLNGRGTLYQRPMSMDTQAQSPRELS
jgi:hypothetical protein